MIFKQAQLADVFIVEPEKHIDERGFFARQFCAEEFLKNGIEMKPVQCNISHNERRGTLRGMHFQKKPSEEAKLVTCIRGAVYDAVIDLRKNSPTYLRWESFLLDEHNRAAVYIPKGCAHGFQTLEDNTDVFYYMNEFYNAEHARGIRYDAEQFQIEWPLTEKITISKKDQKWPTFYLE